MPCPSAVARRSRLGVLALPARAGHALRREERWPRARARARAVVSSAHSVHAAGIVIQNSIQFKSCTLVFYEGAALTRLHSLLPVGLTCLAIRSYHKATKSSTHGRLMTLILHYARETTRPRQAELLYETILSKLSIRFFKPTWTPHPRSLITTPSEVSRLRPACACCAEPCGIDSRAAQAAGRSSHGSAKAIKNWEAEVLASAPGCESCSAARAW